MKIEIWSDIICPFCYIGLKRLQKALQQLHIENETTIIWKSYQLDPYFPTENNARIDTYTYLQQNKGFSREQAIEMTNQLRHQAEEDGISFHFEKAPVVNTKNAHRLLHLALQRGKNTTALKESLFKAHFTEGKNIAYPEVLIELGLKVNLEAKEITEMLNGDEFSLEVREDIQEGISLGLKGVPFFVFDRKYGIPGAHPLDVFMNTIQQCLGNTEEISSSPESQNSCNTETGACD